MLCIWVMGRNDRLLLCVALLLPLQLNALGGACSGMCHHWDSSWINFKESMNKVYRSEDEERERYQIYLSNMEKIKEHNLYYRSNLVPYDMRMNKFGDLTASEFRDFMTGVIPQTPTILGGPFHSFSSLTDSPRHLDLRSRGMVTPVKDQGSCSTGAIFAAIGALEGLLYKTTKKNLPLSEQHILDCTQQQSCEGSSFSKAMTYLTKVGAIAERDYPFEGKKGKCREHGKPLQIKFPAQRHVAPYDRAALEAVLDRVGPVSIQMAPSERLQFYSSGVFRDPFQDFQNSKDFVTLVVGYGFDRQHGAYWLIKNSWGEHWGKKGYLKMAKHPKDPIVKGVAHFSELESFFWKL